MRLWEGISSDGAARMVGRAVPLPEITDNLGDLGKILIPEQFDKYLGNSSEADAVKESGGTLGNKAATAYVDAMGQKLMANSSRSKFGYKFDIVKDQRPNAFALPNGSVYITMGLLRLLRSNAQLANVIGHEVSHVTERHSIQQMQTNFGTIGLLSLASMVAKGVVGKDQANEMKDFVFGIVSNGYSREHESEADEVGQALAAKTGYSPQGMIDVMNILSSLEKEKPKGLDPYFRSHPYAGDRAKLAQQRLPSLPKGEVGAEEYKNFLTKILGIGTGEAVESPVKTGPSFIPSVPPKLLPAAPAQTESSFLVPGLILGGGALALLAAIFLRRK